MSNEDAGNSTLIPHLEFAAAIVGVSIEREYDISTTLNGLAIAAAAVLIDTVVVPGENGKAVVDEGRLTAKVEQFVQGVGKAVEFAKANIDAYDEEV